MPAPLPIGGLTAASVGLTAVVVGNAYYQKKQFYPSVVYITKSNPSMAAIYLLAFTIVILLGKLLKKVFFGQLRTAEFEQLIERSFYAVTETCLAFTVFRDDFSPKFVALFTVLLFLKAFHYLTDSRVDFMERSPVITVLFHIRVASLLGLLMLLDLLLLNHSYLSTITHGASVQLVFGFEYAILLTVVLNITIKYLCHTIDLRSENPWENKAVYLLYTELLVGFVKVILYVVFLFIMIRIHTFPLFIIRPMYLTMRSFKNALNDVIQSRRAIHNMNTLYPDASAEELAAVDNVCIICREEMVTGAKKLPCGHIFHSSCLRSWFQRQQTCPTCRMDILQQPFTHAGAQQPHAAPAPNAAGAPVAGATPPRPQVNQPQINPNIFANFNPGMNLAGGGIRAPFPFAPFPFNVQQNAEGAAGGTQQSTPTAGATSTGPNVPFAAMPPFLPFMGFNIPPPAPPINFEGLTLEELQRMEGNERHHVEARIKTLKNIQTLLDAAVVQLSQYSHVVNSLPVPPPPPPPPPPPSTDTKDKKDETSSTESSSTSTSEKSPVVDPVTPTPPQSCAVGGARPKTPKTDAVPTKEEASSSSASSLAGPVDETEEAREVRLRRLERFSSSSTS